MQQLGIKSLSCGGYSSAFMDSWIGIATIFTAGRLRAEGVYCVHGGRTQGVRVFQPSTRNRKEASFWVGGATGAGGPTCTAPVRTLPSPFPAAQDLSVDHLQLPGLQLKAGSDAARPLHRCSPEAEEGQALAQSCSRAQDQPRKCVRPHPPHCLPRFTVLPHLTFL